MLSAKMLEALNDQLSAEYYSSYLYLSMSAYAEANNQRGFASWLRLQAAEELEHALKFFDFLTLRGGRTVLKAIDAPPTEWKSMLAVFENVLEHERKVTGLINKLVDLSRTESDHATHAFLQWFVSEQVEEEATAEEVLHKIRLVKDSTGGFYMLDRELGKRGKG